MDHRDNKPNTEMYQALKALPKIELHRHLEGSLRLETIATIAREHKFDLSDYEGEDFQRMVQMMPDDPADANVFLSKFETLRNIYRSPEIIERVAYEAVADAAADNIVYMELRFTPMALAREKGYSFAEVSDWVIAAVKRARADFKIDVNLIVSMNRNEPVEIGEECVDISIKRLGEGISAVDLAGAEHKFKGEPFSAVFRKAREAGLGITIHAGEWAGPESVREAIEVLDASRLGHGVRVVEDGDVFKLARDREIAFEVCVTSNIQTGVIADINTHPLPDLYHLGALTTINTDDPGVSAISLTDEYVVAVEHLDFTMDDIKQHVMNAAQVAFLPPKERQKLVKRLSAALYPDPTGETTVQNS
jgi:adenosine deaminase